MLTEKFDAYGEVLPDAARGQREAHRPASARLGRFGHYVFWVLVAVIVSARVMFYPANPAAEFRNVTEARQSVIR